MPRTTGKRRKRHAKTAEIQTSLREVPRNAQKLIPGDSISLDISRHMLKRMLKRELWMLWSTGQPFGFSEGLVYEVETHRHTPARGRCWLLMLIAAE